MNDNSMEGFCPWMDDFIQIVLAEGNLRDITFTRTCLDILNRRRGCLCNALLENLDNCIRKIKEKNMEREFFKHLLANASLTLNGSQINLGGVNTQHNHYDTANSQRPPTANTDDANTDANTDGKPDGGNNTDGGKPDTGRGYLNEHLSSDRARHELAKYQAAGILDEDYQPINLTRPQMGCIVISVGAVLGLEAQWKDFGCLWGIDSELLRTQFGKGKDSAPTRRFNKRIYNL